MQKIRKAIKILALSSVRTQPKLTLTNMDIVYLLKDTLKNEELVYSLRGLENIPHDNVFLVGGCPSEINKSRVIHFQVKQTSNKYRNTTNGLKLICQDPRLSEEFILMNDDFFILKPIKDPEEELNLHKGTMDQAIEDYIRTYGPEENLYLLGMRQTKIFLEDHGIKNPLSYELHIPIKMSKKEVLCAFSLEHINTIPPGHIRTIYGNLFKKDPQFTEDVKVRRRVYCPIYNDKFLSTEDDTWGYVKPYVARLFPEKSPYEI